MSKLVGERTKLSLSYPSDVDPENIGYIVGPDIWGVFYKIVGVEGNRAYFTWTKVTVEPEYSSPLQVTARA